MESSTPSGNRPPDPSWPHPTRSSQIKGLTTKTISDSQLFNPRNPSAAALSRPMMALLLISFMLNAGSGIALWLAPDQQWRIMHGWSTPLFLITLGIILRVHALRGWRLRKNLASGIFTVVSFLLLIVSGWAIYYPLDPQSDDSQHGAAKIHTWIGLGMTFILVFHALRGWLTREPTAKKSP